MRIAYNIPVDKSLLDTFKEGTRKGYIEDIIEIYVFELDVKLRLL